MWVIITVLIGITGGFTGVKLNIPAGAVIGSLISVVAFSILTGRAVFPEEFTTITQIGTGTYIGSRISKKDVIELRKIVKPAIILTVSLCIFNITVSLFLSKNTPIDLVTALFATAPAGITDMTLISVDFGADSSKVAALQLVRLMSMITIIPILIKFFISKKFAINSATTEQGLKDNTTNGKENDFKEDLQKTLYTLAVGVLFGYIGYFTGIPAGVISFSMIACAFYNIKSDKGYMPLNLRRGIQILGGCLIGSKITMEQVASMNEILPSIFMIIIGYSALTFILGFIMTKYSSLDIITALYSSAAGGLTDMTIISSEMGADAPKVASLHFSRVFSVITFYPIIIKVLLKTMA